MTLLTLSFLTGCVTSKDDSVDRASKLQYELARVNQVIEMERKLREEAIRIPPQPKDCGVTVLDTVVLNDSYKQAAEKNGISLRQANDKILRCYRHNEKIRLSREPKKKK